MVVSYGRLERNDQVKFLDRFALVDGGLIIFAETSVYNHQFTLRNIQKERRSHFLSVYKDDLILYFVRDVDFIYTE